MHIFCIHLCISEHLGCFHVLAIINYATVNKGMHITLQHRDSIFYGYVPSSEIAKSYVGLRFNFQRNLYVGFNLTVPIYIPINSTQGFLSSYPCHHVISCFLDGSHSNRYEVMSHCSFDLNFPNVEYFFRYLLAF